MLSPALFKLYINGLPKYLQESPDEVLLNDVCGRYRSVLVFVKGYKATKQI